MKKMLFSASSTSNARQTIGSKSEKSNRMVMSFDIRRFMRFKVCIFVALILGIIGCNGDDDSNNNPVNGSNSGYSLNVSVSPSSAGTVSRSPNATSYASGTVVTVKATPTSGYMFKNWILQDKTYSANPLNVTVNGSATITAVFAVSSSGGDCITFTCPNCNGTGNCWHCNGKGYEIVNGTMKDCFACLGNGRCNTCFGKGYGMNCH
ncbi:MAG: hypothetical protein GX660_12260 [Clostridiaceae bacterium]|nr:hypothetical protein [Clostridiaceae bacterium]